MKIRKTLRQNRRQILAMLAMLGVAGSASVSNAGTYYWDNNTTTVGFGTAGGTWGTAGSTNWSTDAAGTAGTQGTVTTTLATDDVNFGTASVGLLSGSITVASSGAAANSITFGSASGAITLTGGTITMAAAGTITVNNTADTINSAIAGAATSLTVNGTGTLNVGSASGTTSYGWAGSTIVSGGATLVLGSNVVNNITYNSSGYSINGASKLQIVNQRTNFGGNTFTFDSTGGGTFDNAGTGQGGFVFTGGNTFATSGGAADTFSGTGLFVTVRRSASSIRAGWPSRCRHEEPSLQVGQGAAS